MNNPIRSVLVLLIFIIAGCGASETANNEINTYGLTQEQYDFVKNETIPGGKLDFKKQFESSRLTLFDNVAYNQKDAALYIWAAAMKRLGVSKAEDAISLYEELTTTKLRDPEKTAMQNGFKR